jgi:hypothetical protein
MQPLVRNYKGYLTQAPQHTYSSNTYSEFEMTTTSVKWIRTCQECGHEQVAQRPNPSKELTLPYIESKCRACKSPSLDYGHWNNEDDDDA